ncbi:MAG TPA: nitrous oxide-stimulated promoter family protein [bacterium]|nr:nitrous oxide-stimulated promoter family protein [bacterium]
MGDIGKKKAREERVLRRFIEVYCRAHHHPGKGMLCPECDDLLQYSLGRLEKCPYDPKPKCKDCPTHCYRPDSREQIKKVMRFSGTFFVKRGRLDWLILYFWR